MTIDRFPNVPVIPDFVNKTCERTFIVKIEIESFDAVSID